jgi:hypothetical protein
MFLLIGKDEPSPRLRYKYKYYYMQLGKRLKINFCQLISQKDEIKSTDLSKHFHDKGKIIIKIKTEFIIYFVR